MKAASGSATRCCGTPAAIASHSVLRSDIQNQASFSANVKLARPTYSIAFRPPVGSHDRNARYSEKHSGKMPNTPNRIRNGLMKTYGAHLGDRRRKGGRRVFMSTTRPQFEQAR